MMTFSGFLFALAVLPPILFILSSMHTFYSVCGCCSGNSPSKTPQSAITTDVVGLPSVSMPDPASSINFNTVQHKRRFPQIHSHIQTKQLLVDRIVSGAMRQRIYTTLSGN
eukprot:SAG31_NODE_1063_length_10105_cov_4.370778_9_plen_111_part_00